MEENWNVTKTLEWVTDLSLSLYFHSLEIHFPFPTSDLCYLISITHQITVFIIELCY